MDLLSGLLEAVSPTRCGGCDLPGTLLCESCEGALPRIEHVHSCGACGAPYGWLVCTECWQQSFAFEAARCAGTLERPLSRCVTLFKDGGERRLAAVLGHLVAECIEPWQGWTEALVWIPASAAAVRRRGYDHAGLIARSLSAELAVPLMDALTESGRRLDQRTLGRELRRANLEGRLQADRDVVEGRRVLVVDDVMTTGATLDVAAEALLEAGAVAVRVATVARAW